MAKQSCRAREQSDAAQQFRWQSNVSQCGPRDTCAVEWQCAAKYLGVDATNGLEQAQVRSTQALALGDLNHHGGTGIGGFMHRMAQSWHETSGCPLFRDGLAGKLIPLLITCGQAARDSCQHAGEKASGVFCHAEEARAAAQQTRRHRALESIRRAVQG